MRPAKIPLIPAMRPVDRASRTAESPISAPPIAAETGVKLSMTSPLHTLRLRCVEATLSTPFDRDLGSAIREISDDRFSAAGTKTSPFGRRVGAAAPRLTFFDRK